MKKTLLILLAFISGQAFAGKDALMKDDTTNACVQDVDFTGTAFQLSTDTVVIDSGVVTTIAGEITFNEDDEDKDFTIKADDGTVAYDYNAGTGIHSFNNVLAQVLANGNVRSPRLEVDAATEYIDSSGGDLTFTDTNTGTKTLAQLIAGSGDVTKVGTPVDDQIGVWTGDGTLEGTAGLTYDGSNFHVTGDLGITGTRITKGWFTDLEVTNAIAGSITGNAGTVTTITGLAPDTATTQATQAAITTCSNLVTVGTLDSGSISSNFGAIDNGASNIITTGTIGASGAAIANGVTATTQSPSDNSTKIATTAYADAAGGGGGDVSKVGTPVDDQIGVWTGDGTLEGTTGLTYDGSNFHITGDLGITGTRITKGWFTDLEVTNAIAGSVTGNAGTVTTITGLAPDTATTAAAQANITSLGTLTALQVDNINLDLNTISSTAGTDLLITPLAGQQIVLDGAIVIDAGVVTGATSISSTGFTGALTGNADSATALETARTIGGTSFDGTANIVPATITLADETTDTTCFPLFSTAATGAQAPKTGGGLSLNSATSALTATTFIGALTGQADTVATIAGLAPDTATTAAAQANITSLGTLTALQVDNINLDLNTISSTAGTDLLITPLAGQQLVLDGAIVIDAGVVTGATSISSTGFTGALTGQADTVATITGLAPDTATTQATQAAITTCSNLVTVGALDAGSISSNFGAIDTGASNIITTGTIGASGAAIADGVTATTQSVSDNSTKIATTAYADAAGGGSSFGVNTEVLSANKTLTDSDDTVQLLDPNGANRDVYLPASPSAEMEFIIVNNDDSDSAANYLEVSLSGDANYFTQIYGSGSSYFVWDGSIWSCTGPGFKRSRTGADTYDTGWVNTSFGAGAKAYDKGAAVGHQADGNTKGVAVGYQADGYTNGVAVGYQADGYINGVAVGYLADGYTNGVAVGWNSDGYTAGAAVGYNADGYVYGAALGYFADGANYGAALGYDTNTNDNYYSKALGPLSETQNRGELGQTASSTAPLLNNVRKEFYSGDFAAAETPAFVEIYLMGDSTFRTAIPADGSFRYYGELAARDENENVAAYSFTGMISNNGGTTALDWDGGVTVDFEDIGGWDVQVTADDTNDTLKLEFKGNDSDTDNYSVRLTAWIRILESQL